MATIEASREDPGRIDMPELISALSFALDLTEGAVPGHALRSCILGMRIASSIGLSQEEMTDLYYALLLKDIGCSSNAAHMDQIARGENEARKAELRAQVEAEAWAAIRADIQAKLDIPAAEKARQRKLSPFRLFWGHGQPEQPERSDTRKVEAINRPALRTFPTARETASYHGDRGAGIIAKTGLSKGTADTVRALDEHWDGTGYPGRLRREQIPLLARIAAVAQHLDVFACKSGPDHAIAILRQRSGKWFDPEIVRIAVALNRTRQLWKDCLAVLPEQTVRAAVLDLEPRENRQLGPDRIDRICQAFSDITDAKSPFTVDHSMGVTDAAVMISRTLGLSAERSVLVRRAALLHDLGKLRVPNSILHKRGKLTVEEFLIVKEHPALTRKILGRIPAFREMALVAGSHHEKLDGTGYPNQLFARDLSLEARVVAVADVYAALSEQRPYRESLDLDQVMNIMNKEIPSKLDPVCFEALLSGLSQNHGPSSMGAASQLSEQQYRATG
jgi:HD-GYP domain-containing protein (c-di-GMP phosphodiesterase class II)